MVRKTAYAAALLLTLLAPGGALHACEDAECAAPASPSAKSKPLDIMQFMREQAASTRFSEPRRHHSSKTAAKPRRAEHPTVAAQPAPVSPAAAASFASQDKPPVPVVGRSEFNAIDDVAPSPETVGASPANDPSVQVVAAAEFNDIDRKANDIDRKAEEASPFPTIEVPVATAPAEVDTPPPAAQVSWLQWLWSAVAGTFAALAAAVRQLMHL